jgi:glyoxylase-like metal-dependent hydrolase (beta-lactamase superfamily II)
MKTFAALVLLLPFAASAQSTRIYIFDNGMITGLSPALFNFEPEELAEVDFVNISYLIVHPEGTLQFDAGAVADEFEGHDGPVVEGIMSATMPLAPQLANEDHDVFGDGSVIVMSTPGHTPGHQIVAVELENAGWIVLGGDLYHYPEERATGRVPTFEFDAEQSRASRARVEAFLEERDATLWIEHDIATHAVLPRAPDFVD